MVARAACHQLDLFGGEVGEEGVLLQDIAQVSFMAFLASPHRAFALIAAASSVMSMPTGHQVMQRPQPTQPDVPNWSIQVASL